MQRRILLVDNGAGRASDYSPLLQAQGYEVTVARDPGEAAVLIDGVRPDLMVLSVPPNDPRGVMQARELLDRESARGMRTVGLASLDGGPAHTPGAMEGICRFIYSPCRPKTFLEWISHVLRYGR